MDQQCKKQTIYTFILRRKQVFADGGVVYEDKDVKLIESFLIKKEMPKNYFIDIIHNETKNKTGDYKVEIDHVQKKIKNITLKVIVKDE